MNLNNSVHTPKQVIIHTGFPKTASSSIQHSLVHNRNLLETHGFYYPDFIVEGKEFFNRSIPLSGYYMEHPETFKQYWLHNQISHQKVNGLIQNFLEQEIHQYNKLIFSDEFISALNRRSLGKLKRDFEAMGYGIRVISYVREPCNLLVSSVQQRSRTSNINKSLRNINTKASASSIRRLKRVFRGNAEFYSFEKTCQHDSDPVGFFFDLFQIKLAADGILKNK